MKTIASAVAGLALSFSASLGFATNPADLRGDIADDYEYLYNLYTHLHQNPELSFQERETMERLKAEMLGLGFDVTDNVGGYGLVCVMENGAGPTLMIRADTDALPVEEQTGLPYASTKKMTEQTVDGSGTEVSVMHACGHDVHMTVWVGTARRLVDLKDHWSGTLVMIAQPAEERGAGAKAMLEEGLFTRWPRPDYNLALHVSARIPAGTVGFVPEWAMANVDSVDITVHGIGGHGSTPHVTKDPVVIAAQIVTALQTIVAREVNPQRPAVVTVGSIHGGAKHNIISERCDLQLTVRSYDDETRNLLLSSIERIAVNMGRVAGLPEDRLPEVYVKDEFTPSLYNDPNLTERVKRIAETALGADRVRPEVPVMGGEDFGRYGREEPRIPSLLYWLGAPDPAFFENSQRRGVIIPGPHTPYFAPNPELTLPTGVEVMTAAALDLLSQR
ncbi:MAG: amidohydrolase [Planctomycetota bacterium]